MVTKSTAETPDLGSASWRTSSFSSGQGGNCVEVATVIGTTAVRDSKNRDGGHLLFAPTAWNAFIAVTRDGGFTIS